MTNHVSFFGEGKEGHTDLFDEGDVCEMDIEGGRGWKGGDDEGERGEEGDDGEVGDGGEELGVDSGEPEHGGVVVGGEYWWSDGRIRVWLEENTGSRI